MAQLYYVTYHGGQAALVKADNLEEARRAPNTVSAVEATPQFIERYRARGGFVPVVEQKPDDTRLADAVHESYMRLFNVRTQLESATSLDELREILLVYFKAEEDAFYS